MHYELGGDDISDRFPTVPALRRWEGYFENRPAGT